MFGFGSFSDHSFSKGDFNLILTWTLIRGPAGSGLFGNAAQAFWLCGGAHEVHAF